MRNGIKKVLLRVHGKSSSFQLKQNRFEWKWIGDKNAMKHLRNAHVDYNSSIHCIHCIHIIFIVKCSNILQIVIHILFSTSFRWSPTDRFVFTNLLHFRNGQERISFRIWPECFRYSRKARLNESCSPLERLIFYDVFFFSWRQMYWDWHMMPLLIYDILACRTA